MSISRVSVFFLVAIFLFILVGEVVSQVNTDGALTLKREARLTAEESNRRDWLYMGLEMNYVALNAADLITTFYSVDRGAREGNPVARLFMSRKPLAVFVKGGVTFGVLAALRYVKGENKKAAYIALGLLNAMYAVVVTNNIHVAVSL
ncbi:MAG: DUF5658 family protein [Calditrichaeota bacterium]|nr:DUF5658 family protein [Calditrichota bacterium]